MADQAVRLRAFGRYFTDAATPVDLHDDRLIVLDDLSKVLLVEHGAVDVFAVRLENRRPAGRWTFLCRVNAGTLLHGSPQGPQHALVCRPVPRSYVSTLPLSRLAALFSRSDGGTPASEPVRALSAVQYALAVQQLVAGLDGGIVALAQALRDNLPPREFVPLAPDGSTQVIPGDTVRSIDNVLWVRVDDGAVRMPDGIPGLLGAGERLCLTERDWLAADSSARLTASTTLDMLANGQLWRQLIRHATRFLYVIDRRIERRDAVEPARPRPPDRRRGRRGHRRRPRLRRRRAGLRGAGAGRRRHQRPAAPGSGPPGGLPPAGHGAAAGYAGRPRAVG